MPISTENPFVGPRPLELRDGIYGRDDEIRELKWFFTAERIVWLHSRYGAGKTSLIQAGLIPGLQDDDFVILPTIRLNRPASNGGSRYEDSALSCLNATSGLRDFLAKGAIDKSRVLIFDQFEEVLTLDSTDIEAKKAFFEAVGQALQLPDIWALFVIREDYLPALDPYVTSIPTLMNNRFRLDLLTIDQAKTAMTQTAVRGGRDFDAEACASLGQELARVRVGADRDEWKAGRFVEPVILQVVCRSMWDAMRADDPIIDSRHIPAGGQVGKALSAYYASCIKSASSSTSQERAVRSWIGEKLITSGIRNQVLDVAGDGAGIGADIVAALVRTHLIRREDRDTRAWYELAHDRLVDPIRDDNNRWVDEHLNWIQRRADLWRLQDRSKGILLTDEELNKAAQWIKESQPQLTPLEEEFLKLSRDEQKARKRSRQLTILAWISAGLATALLVGAIFFFLEAREARFRELIAKARTEAREEDQVGCAVQHGVEALALASRPSLNQSAMEALSEALQTASAAYEVGQKIIGIAVSPAKSLVAVAETNEVTLFQAPDPTFQHRWKGPNCTFTLLSLTPDGSRIAFSLAKGTLYNEMVTLDGAVREIDCKHLVGDADIGALAFSKNGTLASASSAREINSGRVEIDGKLIARLDATALSFDPDGQLLAVGLRNGPVQILDLKGKQVRRFEGTQRITGLAWGRGALAAVSTQNDTVRVWDGNGTLKRAEVPHLGGIGGVALSPSGSLMATIGSDDRQIKVWQVASVATPVTFRPPPQNQAALTDVLFLDDTHLLVADSNGAVRLYPVDARGLKESAADFLKHHPLKQLCQ